jgi:hypothetical protein
MSKLAATTREPEEWATATEEARALREGVADQVRALIVEGDRMGGREEMVLRIQRVLEAEQRIAEAQGRQQQARENGMALQRHVEAEAEGRSALRAAVMGLSCAAGAWVAALDYAHGRAVRNGGSPAPA